MKPVVNQPLGDIAGLHALLRLNAITEDHFVHGSALVRQVVILFQLFADVVGVEHSVFRGLAKAIGTVGHNVGERTHVHAEIAIEHPHTTDRLRTVIVETEYAVLSFNNNRLRQEGFQNFLASDWTTSRTAAAMRSRKSLVKIEVHHVDAKITRTR